MAAAVALNHPLPNLRVLTNHGSARLGDFRGHQLVIYFYPKDDTSGCTLEGQEFTQLHAQFLAADTQIMGVSRDSLASHRRFITKYDLSIMLAADEDELMCRAFDVIKDKNMYGKMVKGIERSTFLIDRDGIVRQIWRGVKAAGHAQEVLSAAQSLR